MNMRTALLGGTAAFAHMAGLGRSARGRRAEDDDYNDETKGKRSKAEDDEGDDEPKGRRSTRAEDDDRDDEPKGKRSKRADDGDEDDDEPKGKRSRRADDGDDSDEDEPKGKRSKRADDGDEDDDEPKGKRSRRADDGDDDDDDKDEMHGRSAAANARRRERSRCAAIFAHPAAAENVQLACDLAFNTTMTRCEAIAVLKGQQGRGPAAHDVRASRRDRNPDLGPGGQAAPTSGAAVRASWDATLEKLGIAKK